jgi:hypothetical protein
MPTIRKVMPPKIRKARKRTCMTSVNTASPARANIAKTTRLITAARSRWRANTPKARRLTSEMR